MGSEPVRGDESVQITILFNNHFEYESNLFK